MGYIDGFAAAVSDSNRDSYLAHATQMADLFRQYGALRIVESWGSDVPDGKLTSFPMAVKRAPGETVVLSWIEWPSREARDAAWEKLMADPRMQGEDATMPFDGARMIFGGFDGILDA